MATLLLAIIYIAFVSLGLPDALLGSTWPVVQGEFAVPYAFAGIAQVLISAGTIVSSVYSGPLIRRFGTGKLTATSVSLTAIALFGFSVAPSFWWFLLATLPLGLGAGAVDTALNVYVANHYESRHMSWLHSFWGVGALTGPLLVSIFLAQDYSWRSGYQAISVFQALLVLVLFFSIPLWDKVKARKSAASEDHEQSHLPLLKALKLKGAKQALLIFLFYCGIESSMGLWGGSYLVMARGLDPASAASWVSFFFASITLGRFATGFITYRLTNNAMIFGGSVIMLGGAILMTLPLPAYAAAIGFFLVGIGCAPIFPCMIHETPSRFGARNAETIVGYQMALAYTGSTCLPPLFGFISQSTTIKLLPYFIVGYALILIASQSALAKLTQKPSC